VDTGPPQSGSRFPCRIYRIVTLIKDGLFSVPMPCRSFCGSPLGSVKCVLLLDRCSNDPPTVLLNPEPSFPPEFEFPIPMSLFGRALMCFCWCLMSPPDVRSRCNSFFPHHPVFRCLRVIVKGRFLPFNLRLVLCILFSSGSLIVSARLNEVLRTKSLRLVPR